jgi:hypothetical protein
LIAGDFFGAVPFGGFDDDAGTPAGLVFSCMRHNRDNAMIGVSNTRSGSIHSTTAAISTIDTGDARAVTLSRRNSATRSLRG